MLESPLPQWIRDRLEAVVDAYLETIDLVEERCNTLADKGRKNDEGKFCDDTAAIDEYRIDGKYCAGQATRLRGMLRERMTKAEWEQSPYQEIPTDPAKLAEWGWKNPWKRMIPVPTPETAMEELQWKDFFLRFTERERRALVYTIGCRMTPKEAADKMGIKVKTLHNILQRARHRFGPNVTSSHK